MLRLLALRASSQFPVLAAVLAVVTIGAGLLGTCALLLTVSQERALSEGLSRTRPENVSATAFVTEVNGGQGKSVTDATQAAMAASLDPLPVAQTRTRASSIMRPLLDQKGESPQVAYLSGFAEIQQEARLLDGRWPEAAGDDPEVVVLDSTAQRLGLKVGDRVALGKENTREDPGPALTLDIVGVVQPIAGPVWDDDPLQGAGHARAYTSRQFYGQVEAYGPFLTDPAALLASGATIDQLLVTVVPDLRDVDGSSLTAAGTSPVKAESLLEDAVGEQTGNQRVVSGLPRTLAMAQVQQDATRSTVLVMVVLGAALTAAALGLAARLMLSLRQKETALLQRLGAGRTQLAGHASVEALVLAAVAAGLALPLSSLAHTALTRLPRMSDAGMAGPAVVTGPQVASVVVGALLLSFVLVAPHLRPPAVGTSGTRPEFLTRTGIDLLLLVLAGAGWWQLWHQPEGSGTVDTVRVLAPVLFLVAGAAVVPRLLRLPLRLAERRARNSTALVWPLAVFEAARRPRAIAAGLLLSLACATGTFAVGFGATWERSQRDQAAMDVGTDLSVDLVSRLQPGQAAALGETTGGRVTGVTDREITLGSWAGDEDGAFPRLLAIDANRAGEVVKGRSPQGKTWSDVGAQLGPPERATGLRPEGSITFNGRVDGTDDFRVVTRLVVQEGTDGPRVTCELDAFALDGRPHTVKTCAPDQRIVALRMVLRMDPEKADSVQGVLPNLALKVDLPTDEQWTATPQGDKPGVFGAGVKGSDTGLDVRAQLDLSLKGWSERTPLDLILTPFGEPVTTPAVISQAMADALQMSVGDQAVVRTEGVEVPVTVSGIVPTVPSAPGEAAMLVDADNLSRVLILKGRLDPAVDALWVTGPTHTDAVNPNLGVVRTRPGVTEELNSGPLRIGLPASLLVILPVVVLLVLAGTLLHVTADVRARAVEISRLRGLGLSRRDIRGALMAQHGTILALLLAAGAVVGTAATFAVAPLLIRSDLGSAPVPSVLFTWPWGSQAILLALLGLGGLVALTVVIRVQLRRSDAAHLRVGP